MRTLKGAALLLLLLPASLEAAFAGEVRQVKITDLAFAPAELTARVGDTVEWVNDDFIDHTATANGDEWDVMIPAGKSARLELKDAGSLAYFCRFHPNMTAKINVSAK